MIHIRRNEADVPADWLQRAEELAAELRALPAEERAEFIKGHQTVWKDLKEVLLRWSFGKCWYSEAKDCVSDWHVDHFRPKCQEICEEDGRTRPGYWWLAFEWRNFRVAGAYSNSPHTDDEGEVRGKRDKFPMMQGSPVAVDPDDDIATERCCLLDPTNRDDPVLITFDETGQPCPVPEAGEYVRKRVDTTVNLLFLDAPRLVEKRRDVWRRCRQKLDEANDLMAVREDQVDDLRAEQIRRVLDELHEMIAPQAELSATARACLAKSGYHWAMRLAAA